MSEMTPKQQLTLAIEDFSDARTTGNQRLIAVTAKALDAILQTIPDDCGIKQAEQE